jgi:hypothetical protein
MSGPFEITTPSNTVTLDEKTRQGIATFTVKNISRRRLRASGRIVTKPADSPAAKWIAILGPDGQPQPADSPRDFNVDESKQYQVRVAPTADAAPGSYTFNLLVAEELNPDDNFTASSDMVATVSQPVKEEAKKLPPWLIPVIVFVVIVVVVGIIATVLITNNQRNINATATAVVLGATATSVFNSTATAEAGATATASILQTQAAQNATIAVQQTATTAAIQTQTAIDQAMSPYLGDWVEASGQNLPTMSITKVNNNTLSVGITYCSPPDANFCLASGSASWGPRNVNFTPPTLTTVFGTGSLVTIAPADSNRLGLTIAINGFSSAYAMKPKCDNPFLCAVILFPLSEVNTQFRPFVAPTVTPS